MVNNDFILADDNEDDDSYDTDERQIRYEERIRDIDPEGYQSPQERRAAEQLDKIKFFHRHQDYESINQRLVGGDMHFSAETSVPNRILLDDLEFNVEGCGIMEGTPLASVVRKRFLDRNCSPLSKPDILASYPHQGRYNWSDPANHSFYLYLLKTDIDEGNIGVTEYLRLPSLKEVEHVPNLYAIVMNPSLYPHVAADSFMMPMLDDFLTADQYVEISKLRALAFNLDSNMEIGSNWNRHDEIMSLIIKALPKYHYSKPRIVIFPSVHTAKLSGAKILGVYDIEHYLADSISGEQGLHHLLLNRRYKKSEMTHESYQSFPTYAHMLSQIARDIMGIGLRPGVYKYLTTDLRDIFKDKHRMNSIEEEILLEKFDSYADKPDLEFNWATEIDQHCRKGELDELYYEIYRFRVGSALPIQVSEDVDFVDWVKLICEIDRQLKLSDQITLPELISLLDKDPKLDLFKVFPFEDIQTERAANITLRKLLRRVIKKYIDDWDVLYDILEILNSNIGNHHTFVVGKIVAYFGLLPQLEKDTRDKLMVLKILCIDQDNWSKITKVQHRLVRSGATFFGVRLNDLECSILQYFELLHMRRNYEIDGEKEIEKRRIENLTWKHVFTGKMCNTPDYISIVNKIVENLYCDLGQRRSAFKYANLQSFFEYRTLWVTRGAVTLITPDIKALMDERTELKVWIDDQFQRIEESYDKEVLMREMTLEQLISMMYKHYGFNDTSFAFKPNEPVKKRVLMPGSFMHFVLVTYLLLPLEKSGNISNAILGDGSDNNLKRYGLRHTEGTINLMYDFADHNAQHSSQELKIVLGQLAKLSTRDNEEEFQFAISSIIASFDMMRVKYKGEIHELRGGLFTGWRNTTWTNTVLMVVYVMIGEYNYTQKYGSCDIQYFEGCGDDVVLKFRNLSSVLKFYAIMDYSAKGEPIKQLIVRDDVEFLRTRIKKGVVYACINRTLPNFISGDLERSNPTVIERAASAYTTTKLLERRGLVPWVSSMLYDIVLDKWMRVKKGDGYEPINRCILHGRREDGGAEIPDKHDNIWILDTPIVRNKSKITDLVIKKDMFYDHAERDSKELIKYGIELNKGEYANRLAKMSIEGKVLKTIEQGYSDCFSKPIGVVPKHNIMNMATYRYIISNNASQLINQYKAERGGIVKYLTAAPFSQFTKEEFFQRLSSRPSKYFLDSENFTVGFYYITKVPEIILNVVLDYYKMMVFFGLKNLDEALFECETVLNAGNYCPVFAM